MVSIRRKNYLENFKLEKIMTLFVSIINTIIQNKIKNIPTIKNNFKKIKKILKSQINKYQISIYK